MESAGFLLIAHARRSTVVRRDARGRDPAKSTVRRQPAALAAEQAVQRRCLHNADRLLTLMGVRTSIRPTRTAGATKAVSSIATPRITRARHGLGCWVCTRWPRCGPVSSAGKHATKRRACSIPSLPRWTLQPPPDQVASARSPRSTTAMIRSVLQAVLRKPGRLR